MIQALIFDFDGLILDTETPDFLSWQETYAELGCELPLDVWRAQIGAVTFNPYLHLEALLGRPIDREAVWARRKQRDNELLAQQTILPGVEAYLAQAEALGLKIGLASSSNHDWVDAHLQRLGLFDRFVAICCRDDVGDRGKPDPAVYKAVVAALNVASSQSLALEDSPNGVTAAKEAGLWCAAVPNQMTHMLDFSHADIRLNALTDMPLRQLLQEVIRDPT